MQRRLLRITGLAAVFAGIGLIWVIAAHAQPAKDIKWIGCLVVGQGDPIDQIARGPFPTTVHQVEIGLRSDGVVVWRNASNAK